MSVVSTELLQMVCVSCMEELNGGAPIYQASTVTDWNRRMYVIDVIEPAATDLDHDLCALHTDH